MSDSTQYPSLPEQGANLSKFVFEILKKSMKGDALMVSQEIADQRMEICKTCEYYDEEQVRCRHCGCYLGNKVKWALDGCPIEKWTSSDQDWTQSKFDELVQHVQNGTEPVSPYQPAEPPPFPDVFAEDILPGYIFEYNDVKWEFTGSTWQPVG
jgi:hypothetical protein